jgi:DNA uptake protein ComE-like DNA-binding protein
MPGKTANNNDLRPTVLLALGLLLILINLFPVVADEFEDKDTEQETAGVVKLQLPSSPQADFLLFKPVSVNQAGKEMFTAIPGIGPGISAEIIALRTRKGSFSRLEELLEVKGIGPRKFAELRKYCRL